MTIYKDIVNTRPMNLEYMATSQDVSTIKTPVDVVTSAFCPCDFECEYIEMAFGNNDGGADEFKNDITRELVKLTTATDVVSFDLIDTITGEEYDLTSGLYGTYYPNGFQSSNPLYTGVEVEWNKVLTLIGSSYFKIKITQESLGQTFIKNTHKYYVIPFSELAADNTIRIKSTHNGYFTDGFDYKDLGWISYVRIPATVINKTPTEEKTEFTALKGTVRTSEQIQERTITEWVIKTNLLPSEVYNGLIYDKLKASKIQISDYARMAKEKLRNLEVRYDGSDGVEWISDNTKAVWTWKFTENKIKVKRNYR